MDLCAADLDCLNFRVSAPALDLDSHSLEVNLLPFSPKYYIPLSHLCKFLLVVVELAICYTPLLPTPSSFEIKHEYPSVLSSPAFEGEQSLGPPDPIRIIET